MQPRIFQMKEGFPIAFKLSVPENIHTHPMEGYWKFKGGGDGRGRGGGSQRPSFFKASIELKWNFWRGGRKKNIGGIDTFWNHTISRNSG